MRGDGVAFATWRVVVGPARVDVRGSTTLAHSLSNPKFACLG